MLVGTLIVVGSMALLLAVALAVLAYTLKRGALPETKDGLVYTRVHNPIRFWLSICGQVLFIAATAVMVHAIGSLL
ncbi:MAG: hypothetical protein ACKVRO_02090 [Micropepsaceae bacterium]